MTRIFRSPLRIGLTLLAVAAVVAGGLTAWSITRPKHHLAKVAAIWVPVRELTLSQTVRTSGNLQPTQEADLSFPASGTVTSVLVQVGETVGVAQVLATIGDAALVADLDAAQETLDSAEASFAEDAASGAGPAQLDLDRATIIQDQSQLTSAQQAVAGATMVSPIAGEVVSVDISVGELVQGGGGSGGSGGSGQPDGGGSGGSVGSDSGQSVGGGSGGSGSGQIVVIGTSAWTVTASVDATQILELADGDPATVTGHGTGSGLQATVTQIGLLPSGNDPLGGPSYPVTISVTGTPQGLVDGEQVNLSIVARQIKGALAIPSSALLGSGTVRRVLVRVDGHRRVQRVTVGISSGPLVQILSGVKPGEEVLESGSVGTVTSGGPRGAFEISPPGVPGSQ